MASQSLSLLEFNSVSLLQPAASYPNEFKERRILVFWKFVQFVLIDKIENLHMTRLSQFKVAGADDVGKRAGCG